VPSVSAALGSSTDVAVANVPLDKGMEFRPVILPADQVEGFRNSGVTRDRMVVMFFTEAHTQFVAVGDV
jgi:hypothetical protein